MAPARELKSPRPSSSAASTIAPRFATSDAGADLGGRHGAERRNRRSPARGNAGNFALDQSGAAEEGEQPDVVGGVRRHRRRAGANRTPRSAGGHRQVGDRQQRGGQVGGDRGGLPVARPTSQPWAVTSRAAVATSSGLARSRPPTSTSPGAGPAPGAEQGARLLLDRRDPALGGVREVHRHPPAGGLGERVERVLHVHEQVAEPPPGARGRAVEQRRRGRRPAAPGCSRAPGRAARPRRGGSSSRGARRGCRWCVVGGQPRRAGRRSRRGRGRRTPCTWRTRSPSRSSTWSWNGAKSPCGVRM